MTTAPLTDSIVVAISQLVDDAQSSRRDPSHSELDSAFSKASLVDGDPKKQGQTVGKAKRVRAVLSWAIEHNPSGGALLVAQIIELIRGHGGFRDSSSNYVGLNAIESARSIFSTEGYDLSLDGELRPKLLDNLSGALLTDALESYVRRAKKGSTDAALVTGTGKDLLEAVAAHILQQRYGSYSHQSNFPTLLGQVFVALNLATTADAIVSGESPNRRIERAMFDLACGINQLRNKQGIGHGRPWLPTVTENEARMAIEVMGVIAERLLSLHAGKK